MGPTTGPSALRTTAEVTQHGASAEVLMPGRLPAVAEVTPTGLKVRCLGLRTRVADRNTLLFLNFPDKH